MERIDTGKTKPDRGLTSVTTIVSVIIIAVLVFAAISAAAFVMYGSGTGGFGSGQSGGRKAVELSWQVPSLARTCAFPL